MATPKKGGPFHEFRATDSAELAGYNTIRALVPANAEMVDFDGLLMALRNLLRCHNYFPCLHAGRVNGFKITTDGTDITLTDGANNDTTYTLTPLDATLLALAATAWAANAIPIGTGTDTLSQTTFAANTFPARASTGNLVAKTITDFALTILDDADAAAVRTTIGAGTGDVTGPAGAVSGNLPNFSGTSGKIIADSGVATLDLATLSGNLSGIGDKSTALTNLGILRGIVADDLTFASTTMAAVTGMTVTVEASSLYQFEADILISGATLDVEDPDNSRTGAKFDFGGGTATITSTNYGYTLISNTTGTFVMEVTALTTDISDAADGTKRRYRIQGHVHSNAAGTIIMQAAANTGTTTPTSEATVHKGTWMRLTKVG